MAVKSAPREAAKLIVFAFALGAAFQLGVGLTSLATPTMQKIEIHPADKGAAAPSRLSF